MAQLLTSFYRKSRANILKDEQEVRGRAGRKPGVAEWRYDFAKF